MIGSTILHYKILEKLGEGGMGVVYKAKDTKLGRTVALKFLPDSFSADEEAKKRFLREAHSASMLDHPNICTIYEINDTEDGQLFISMAFYEGETLRDKIAKGPIEIEEAIKITLQICEGLEKAHKNEIIHRDIKPANIFITNDGIVKILDFGLAKAKGQTQLTKMGSTLGTVDYMSPEQATGNLVDKRTDIWSLGVMFYEMITGQRPFGGEYEQAVIYSILNEEPKSVSTLRSEIPDEFEKIVIKSLNKNLSDRYQDMNTLWSDLQKFKKKNNHITTSISNKGSDVLPSIAVLPFVNLSADPENEYFSDGLTEELINSLTQLKGLRVVARTSSFAFKGKEIDIRNIGNQLNVQKVLEGSVRKAGNRIRITAQLINIEDGYHEWSERYDRNLEDVFAIQDEISAEIAGKLKSEIARRPTSAVKEKRPDLEAYELYLKGRYYFNRFSPETTNKALECFSEAISIDPDFAPAHAGMADMYIFLTNPVGTLDNNIAMPKAKAAAEKAIELDPHLSDAYVSMGSIATFYEWDSAKAHHYFNRAIELNVNSAYARMWYELAFSLLDQDFDGALSQLRTALDLDPLNMFILGRMGYVYVYKYEFDKAVAFFKKMIEYAPEHAAGYHGLQDAYGLQGKYDLAIQAGEKAINIGTKAPNYVIGTLGLYYGRSGNMKSANEVLNMLLQRSESETVSTFWIAVIYLGMGQYDKMFELFDEAFEKHDSNLLYLFVPVFDPIRDDPRFIALHKKLGLKPQ